MSDVSIGACAVMHGDHWQGFKTHPSPCCFVVVAFVVVAFVVVAFVVGVACVVIVLHHHVTRFILRIAFEPRPRCLFRVFENIAVSIFPHSCNHLSFVINCIETRFWRAAQGRA